MEIAAQGQQQSVEFDYADVQAYLKQLVSDWKSPVNTGGVTVTDTGSTLGATSDQFKGEEVTSRIRRELRRDNRDLPIMRARGEVSPDGNYIPRRVIDKQIASEKPQQIAFLEQPDRLLIFKDLSDAEQPTEDLERAFTDHMRYPGWTVSWHRAFDGCDLHGGVCLEVKVDTSKPFKCAVEYIRREDLIFSTEATEIQGNEYIMRRYRYMPFEIESFVKKYGFDEAAVKEVTANTKQKRHQKLEIFKCWTKRNGIVYVFWYAEACQSAFLKAPEVLDLGIKDPQECQSYLTAVTQYADLGKLMEMGQVPPEMANVPPPAPPQSLPCEDYPVFFLPYEVIEDDRLLASKGLAFRHRSDQEAVTELWTSLINAANRASKLYASYANDPTNQTGIKPEDKLTPDTIMAKEIKWWSFPFPDATLVGVVQAFENNIAASSNRVDYAVNNRQDSRKTAEEIKAATNQAAQQMSVGISGQSLTVLAIYSLCWHIGRSFTLLGEVPTFPITRDRLLHTYVLASAGDSDVVRREQRKQIIRETFQYLVGTPIGNQFLVYLVNTFFPEQSKKWVPMLEAQDPLPLIQAAAEILSTVPRTTLTPVQNAQLDELINVLRTYVSTRTGQGNVQGGAPQLAESSSNTVPNNLPKEQGGAASGASGG